MAIIRQLHQQVTKASVSLSYLKLLGSNGKRQAGAGILRV